MFNTRVKKNLSRASVAKVGVAVGVVKESFDNIDVTAWHVNSFQEAEDSLVGYAIEGFKKINKKDVIEVMSFKSTVKLLIVISNVGGC